MYIVAFYLGALPGQHLDRWNDNLPGLYSRHSLFALAAISAHLATGSVVLLLGPQLIGVVRRRWPSFHRWCGRLYVLTAGLAGIRSLSFIVSRGTIGRAPMNAGLACMVC